jgi:peptide/nickel transport system substrate-binding protein
MKKYLFIILIFFLSCNNKDDKNLNKISSPANGGALVIGIPNDFDFLNPILSMDLVCESVQDLVFPSLLDMHWNDDQEITFEPYYANSWQFSPDYKTITFNLKNNIYWEDGKKVIPADLVFSYKLYQNPAVASAKQNWLKNLDINPAGFRNSNGTGIDIINDTTIRFHFSRRYSNQMIHSNLKFIAKHIFEKTDPKNLQNDTNNFKPIGAGPYKLLDWKENQLIILGRNDNYKLSNKPFIDKIIFRVLPEPLTRITALKQGEVDFIEGIKPDDVNELRKNKNLSIISFTGRNYDYISWSNIDNSYYHKTKKIKPHSLFGDKRIRRALTMGINRQDIIRSYLGEFSRSCNGPISPVFKWAYNDQLKPVEYNPEKAKSLLQECGWSDKDGDGIIEKDGKKFKFTLYYQTGNSRREYVANIVQNNLKMIGIDIDLQKMEWNVFTEKMNKREIDAFISGNGVDYTFDLINFWGSDLEKCRLNDPGFQNKRVDELLELADNTVNLKDSAPYWKEFQEIINEEQPCTFLYWYALIIGHNTRIKNVKSNIWDSYNHIWEWKINN